MSVRSRITALRRSRLSRRLPRLPQPPRERPIVIRTEPPKSAPATGVPTGVRNASEWAWRSAVIAAFVYGLLWLVPIVGAVVTRFRGIIGALVAVPLLAVLNAVTHNLVESGDKDVDHH